MEIIPQFPTRTTTAAGLSNIRIMVDDPFFFLIQELTSKHTINVAGAFKSKQCCFFKSRHTCRYFDMVFFHAVMRHQTPNGVAAVLRESVPNRLVLCSTQMTRKSPLPIVCRQCHEFDHCTVIVLVQWETPYSTSVVKGISD